MSDALDEMFAGITSAAQNGGQSMPSLELPGTGSTPRQKDALDNMFDGVTAQAQQEGKSALPTSIALVGQDVGTDIAYTIGKTAKVVAEPTLNMLHGAATIVDKTISPITKAVTGAEESPEIFRLITGAAKKYGAPDEFKPSPDDPWYMKGGEFVGQVVGGILPYLLGGAVLKAAGLTLPVAGAVTEAIPGILGKTTQAALSPTAKLLRTLGNNALNFGTTDVLSTIGQGGGVKEARDAFIKSIPNAALFSVAEVIPFNQLTKNPWIQQGLASTATGTAFAGSHALTGETDPGALAVSFLTGFGIHAVNAGMNALGQRKAANSLYNQYVLDWKKENNISDEKFNEVQAIIDKIPPSPTNSPEEFNQAEREATSQIVVENKADSGVTDEVGATSTDLPEFFLSKKGDKYEVKGLSGTTTFDSEEMANQYIEGMLTNPKYIEQHRQLQELKRLQESRNKTSDAPMIPAAAITPAEREQPMGLPSRTPVVESKPASDLTQPVEAQAGVTQPVAEPKPKPAEATSPTPKLPDQPMGSGVERGTATPATTPAPEEIAPANAPGTLSEGVQQAQATPTTIPEPTLQPTTVELTPEITAARDALAKERGVTPEELTYKGVWPESEGMPGQYMFDYTLPENGLATGWMWPIAGKSEVAPEVTPQSPPTPTIPSSLTGQPGASQSLGLETQAGRGVEGGVATIYDKGVRNAPQRATIVGDNIRIDSYVGRKKADSYEIPIKDIIEARNRYGNPAAGIAELFNERLEQLAEEPGGFGQAQRILDSQARAVTKLLFPESTTPAPPTLAEKAGLGKGGVTPKSTSPKKNRHNLPLNDPNKVIAWAVPTTGVKNYTTGGNKQGWKVIEGSVHPKDIGTDIPLTDKALNHWRANKNELGMVNLKGLSEADIQSIISAAKRDEASVTVNRMGDFASYRIKNAPTPRKNKLDVALGGRPEAPGTDAEFRATHGSRQGAPEVFAAETPEQAQARIKTTPRQTKGKGSNPQRAIERNDLAALLHNIGGIDPKAYAITGNFNLPEEKMALGRTVLKKGGLAPDIAFEEAKTHFPDQFGHFTDAEDMLRYFVDGRYQKFLNQKSIEQQFEDHYADIEEQAAREGLSPEALARVEADVEREIAAEREAIRSEGSAGAANLDTSWDAASALGLSPREKPASRLTARLDTIQADNPGLDANHLELVLKTFPDGPTDQIVRMAKDPKVFDQLRRQRLQKMSDSGGDSHQMQSLPGTGGLFGEPGEGGDTLFRLQDLSTKIDRLTKPELNYALSTGIVPRDVYDTVYAPKYGEWGGKEWAKSFPDFAMVGMEAPRFKTGEPNGVTEPLITTDTLQKAFGKDSKVTESTFIPNTHEVTLADGRRILIWQNGTIEVEKEALNAYGKTELGPTDYIAGRWQPIDQGGIITLAKGEGGATLHHEILHAAEEMVLTPREIAALEKKYGDVEARARAYEEWNPKERPDTAFQKILDFFRNIYRSIFPNAESVFEKVRSGEVWGREAKGGLPEALAPSRGQIAKGGLPESIAPSRLQGEPPEVKYLIKKTRFAQEPQARRVEEMYEGDESQFKELRSTKLSELWKKMKHLTVDTAANIKKQLLAEGGAAGREVIMNHDLSRGASAKAQQILEVANSKIYDGLSKADEILLNRVIQSRRTIAIEAYKPDMMHPGMLGAADHQAYLDSMPPALAKRLNARADAYFAAMKDNLTAMRDAGLINEQNYQEMVSHGDYSPRRFIQYIDPDVTGFTAGGRKITVPDSGIQRLEEGSDQALENNSRMLLGQTVARTQARIMKNEANKSLWNLTKEVPDNGIVRVAKRVKIDPNEVNFSFEDAPPEYDMTAAAQKVIYKYESPGAGETYIKFRENGQEKRLIMPDKYAREWVQSDPMISSLAGQIIGYASGAKILQAMATGMNPGFALTNLPRDIAHIWLVSSEYSKVGPKYLGQMGKDILEVAKDAIGRKGAYKDFINQGGGMSFLTNQGQVQRLPGVFGTIQHYLGWVGETSEILTRLAVRNRALKNGKAPQEATWAARNYLDFAQGGSFAKAADSAIPYLNASIQGTRMIAKAAHADPKLFMMKVGQIGALAVGLYLANTLVNKDAWDQIPENEKVTNWIITTPFSYLDELGNKRYHYFRIAKDQGQRVFASAFEGMMALLKGEKVDGRQIASAVGDFLPLVPNEKLPPTFQAMIGYLANKDFWRNRDIWRGPKVESSEEYNRYTHPLLIKAGEVTGLSPERLGYALGTMIPATNSYVSMVGGGIKSILSDLPEKDREKTLGEILGNFPMANKLMRSTDPYVPYQQEIEGSTLQENTQRFKQRRELEKLIDANFSLPLEERMAVYSQYITAQPPNDTKRLIREVKNYEAYHEVPDRRWWLSLSHLAPEVRAEAFYKRYKAATPDKQEVLRALGAKLPGINSEAFRNRLAQLDNGLEIPDTDESVVNQELSKVLESDFGLVDLGGIGTLIGQPKRTRKKRDFGLSGLGL
ncbi:MAG: LPD38 domain-containing protein [Candidatus Micrarchaeia archaeon]|jgi:hypothetical protein